MKNSFTPIEEMIAARAQQYEDFPHKEILLTRLVRHFNNKLLEKRNAILKKQDINETLFMALITLDSQVDQTIQPSELSLTLGTSRTHITRISDELVERGWVERLACGIDRRCFYLRLTLEGKRFLNSILPPQFASLRSVWSVLSLEEQQHFESLTRKLLSCLDKIELSNAGLGDSY